MTQAEVVSYFDDDQCQVPIALAKVLGATCASVPRFALAGSVPDTTVHAIGERHAGPLYHLSTGDRCLPFEPTGAVAYHAIGPALASELATGERVIDE